jgi:GTPase SAR1 family protein
LSGIEAEEDADNDHVATYKVGMLGASEVGKTALTAQFTTSDYICAYDASLGKCAASSHPLSLSLFLSLSLPLSLETL